MNVYGYVASFSTGSYNVEFIDDTGNTKVSGIVVDLPTLIEFQIGSYSPAVASMIAAKWPDGPAVTWIYDPDNDEAVITARQNYADVEEPTPDPTVALVELAAANIAAAEAASNATDDEVEPAPQSVADTVDTAPDNA